MRLLIYIILFYLVYRVARSLLKPSGRQRVQRSDTPPMQADDIMIQDPQCGTYFARRDGVALTHNGQALYFCSESCKEKFLLKHKRMD
jgi:YHS domain-containing protein